MAVENAHKNIKEQHPLLVWTCPLHIFKQCWESAAMLAALWGFSALR